MTNEELLDQIRIEESALRLARRPPTSASAFLAESRLITLEAQVLDLQVRVAKLEREKGAV